MQKKKVLVTGGAGFIGSHIVDACIQAGHETTIVDNFSTGQRENLNPDAALYEMNIQDPDIDAVIKTRGIQIVFHQAAQMDVRRSVQDPVYDAQNNILGFINVMQSCARHAVEKVIFASSGGAIYGEQEQFPADEGHPVAPCSPYGITKLTGEKYLYYYSLNRKFSHIALRYANVYGPRQNPHGEAGVVAIFTKMMLEGKQPIINGDGTQTRDFVFVGDVVNANLRAMTDNENNVFNIGTGSETTINAIFQKLKSITGARCEEKHGPAQKGEQLRSVIDPHKAETHLGWRARVGLDEGLEQTVAYFRQHISG